MIKRPNLLEVKNLKLMTPHGRTIAHDLSFDVHAGQVVNIQGGNGSGKTTLLRCILGLWPHYQGQVSLNVKPELISYLPQIQAPETHMPLSLGDILSISSPKLEEDSFLSVGLLKKHQLSYRWNTASGGEKQRVLLTRIFIKRPTMIILDEPFNHLDQESYELISRRLLNFVEKDRGALIMVSHDSQCFEHFENVSRKKVEL